MSRSSLGFISRVSFLVFAIALLAKVAPCTQIAAIPTFSLRSGTFAVTQSTAISTTAGSVICYNTTGSPSTDGATGCQTGSTLYTGPISVTATETLYAVAGGTGYTDSAIATIYYGIDPKVFTRIYCAAPSDGSTNICPVSFLVPPGTVPPFDLYGHPTNLAQSWAKATVTVIASLQTGSCDLSSYNTASGCLALGGNISYAGVPYSPEPLQVTGLVPLPTDIANLNIPASLITEARHEVATLRGIADDDANVDWSRGEIRAYLFLRLLQIANLTRPLTTDEKSAFEAITNEIIAEQTAIANEAQFLYQQWSINPCTFTLPPGAGSDPNEYLNDSGTVAYCAPKAGFAILQNQPIPSAAKFTQWAQGTRMAGRIAAWGQQTYALTSPVPSDGTVQATAEYGNVFAGIYEGLGFLTSQHASIATVDASTLTAEQADVQGIWMDGLTDVAKDRAYDSVGPEVCAIVDLLEAESEAVGKELAEEIAQLAGAEVEAAETGAGLVISGAVVTALGLWQDINNAQVPVDLKTSVHCAAAYNSGCTDSTTSPTRATLHDYAQDTGGRQLILEALVRSTMPDYLKFRSATSVVSAQGPTAPMDPKFSILSLGSQAPTTSNTFSFYDWSGTLFSASVSNGWLVQQSNGGSLLRTPVLDYQTASSKCVDTACSTIQTINPEQWRAWIDGYNFHSQRISVIAGSAAVEDTFNTCPGFLDPNGGGRNLGNVCVHFSGNPTIQINVGDQIAIGNEVQKISNVTVSNGDTYVQTVAPFLNSVSNAQILLMAGAYGDCQSSGVSALGARASGPDCVTSPTISTGAGLVSIVQPTAPTITFDLTSQPKTYGNPAFSVASAFSSNSSGAVTFSSGTGSTGCTVASNGTITITSSGTCVVGASQAAAIGFKAAGPISTSFQIDKAQLMLTANPISKPYGQTYSFAGTEFTSVGLVNGDQVNSVTLTSTGTAANALVGGNTYTIVISSAVGSGLANYSIVYNNGNLTVTGAPLTFTANSISKNYGQTVTFTGNEFTVSGQLYNGDTLGSTVTLASAGAAATAGVAQSPYTINASNVAIASGPGITGGVANYQITYNPGILKVIAIPLTITANSIASKMYGQTAVLTYTPAGLINGDTVTGISESSAGTPATASVGGSPYPILIGGAVIASNGGPGNANYTIGYVNGSLTVKPIPLTITANSIASKMYGQTAVLTYTPNGLVNGDTVTSASEASAGAAATAGVTGSPYPITIGGAVVRSGGAPGNVNYIIGYVGGTLTVVPAPLTITASSPTMIINAPVPAITASYAGFVNSEGPGALTPGPTCSTTVTSSSTVGIYTNASTCHGASDANYTIGYVPGTVKVTYAVTVLSSQTKPSNVGSSAPIMVQLKNYGGTNLSSPNITVTVTGFAPSPGPGVPPTGNFTFMPTGNSGANYQYNLKTTNYPKGTYTFIWTATGDPIPHTLVVLLN